MKPNDPSSQAWILRDRFLEIHSRWFDLIGEHLQDHQGQELEYWRIEKADSVIVVPIHQNHLLLPAPTYRPGISQATWDFPGGRVRPDQTPAEAAIATLTRELGILETAIVQLTPLNSVGWAVNSSFSNQKLHGFVAEIAAETPLLPEFVAATYPTTPESIQSLLQLLTCLQCRAVLLDWWWQFQKFTESGNSRSQAVCPTHWPERIRTERDPAQVPQEPHH